MYFSGQHGSLDIDGLKAAKVTDWQITGTSPQLDVSSLGDTDAVITPGIRSTSGSCTLFYYEPADNHPNDASKMLNKILKAQSDAAEPGQADVSDKVTLTLIINDGTTQGKRIKVDAFITSATIGMAVNSISTASIAFTSIGAPVEVSV